MLTRKQKELLCFIRERVSSDGVPPSFDEMKAALGLRSKSGIHRLISGLEERGFIRRLPHRARALEVLRMPEGGEPLTTKAQQTISAIADKAANLIETTLALPFCGRIAAGTPIEAITPSHQSIDVPLALLASAKGSTSGEHYVLEIAGDSMIEAGIMDGDQVIIRKADTADNGSIVVALVDDHEATLKYMERRPNAVALIPANPQYETRLLPANRVKIQGRLVGLLRKY